VCSVCRVKVDNSFDTAVGGGVAKCHKSCEKLFAQRVNVFLNRPAK